MAVVFARLGQEAHITGGLLADAVNRGVARGYTEGYLRCSVVADPLRRVNTGNNTPAVLHVTLTEGDALELMVAPKGFGSENMSRIYMLTPAADRKRSSAASSTPSGRREAIPAAMVLGWASEGTSSFALCWPSGPSAARWISRAAIPSTPAWSRTRWRRSIGWASGRRASAALPPPSGLPSRPIPPISPVSRWPSTWAAT